MPTRTRWPGDDGYDRMTFARRLGWDARPQARRLARDEAIPEAGLEPATFGL